MYVTLVYFQNTLQLSSMYGILSNKRRNILAQLSCSQLYRENKVTQAFVIIFMIIRQIPTSCNITKILFHQNSASFSTLANKAGLQ